ncbi:acylphosphatase [Streptomonospora sp. S1-112]|uniref:acylphosphatase n=1 Tax=Streptomonospora mangrovi TaxID=2883123 RepID=A0A9X3NGN9_9ACTN|nr:acylphosphatase [Streptomonospora mangrovi]MDA0562808.1 acylphosphatase [Streptomonospora mangrovi]
MGETGRGDAAGAEAGARLTAWVRGRVQGVGFRWWVRSRALELGLSGAATNLADGRVEVVAEGPRERCAQLLALLRGGETPGEVTSVVERWENPRGTYSGFAER